ncbi:BspA family leucine-rich repeat surface protein [Pseudactinotalea terrae]|uniref:BspA family leucine-rich repeat surface protein n=1 Tax=Pseudactinotalea terrae TaxID=1743262 RepID=UPI0012E316A3|nr:BspA family leucine-rich repeat surface protein [Pseudactinotalea terrae]
MGRLTRALPARSRGFTLVELLVTIVIIGIVAAIAVPFFMNQRDKGHDAAVRSDLKNAATLAAANYDPAGLGYANEQVFTDRNGELRSNGGTYVGFADTDSFVLYGQSRSGRLFTLTSADGGVPVAVAAGTSDASNLVLATAGLGAPLAAGGDILNLPGLTDTPPPGIERPYAAITWGEGDSGQERASEFFPGDGPAPGDGDGDGGGIVIPTSSTLVYDMSLAGCTAATSRTLYVPAFGSDYAIDWGDGTVTEDVNTHTYAEAGRYTVTLTGTIERFGLDWSGAHTSYLLAAACLAEASYSAPAHETISMRGGFAFATNLTDVDALDTTGVVDLGGLFYCAAKFNGPLDLDTSAVTDMSKMFEQAEAFNQPVDFDTSNVTDMTNMFYYARAFNQPVEFDTSSVTSMSGMFFYARAFNQPLNWNTENVTNMSSMFYEARVFNQPLLFDTGNVTDFSHMFRYTPVFNQPLAWDTANGTSFDHMFRGAAAFNQDISSWSTASAPTKPASFNDGSALLTSNLPPAWR